MQQDARSRQVLDQEREVALGLEVFDGGRHVTISSRYASFGSMWIPSPGKCGEKSFVGIRGQREPRVAALAHSVARADAVRVYSEATIALVVVKDHRAGRYVEQAALRDGALGARRGVDLDDAGRIRV
jgi:hypothetical protein